MPTNQPSNAPQDAAPVPTDDLTAAAVLTDDSLDQPAGGGGLGGASASAAVGKTGAASPNSPIDAALPHDGGAGQVESEARLQATSDAPAEPGHDSR